MLAVWPLAGAALAAVLLATWALSVRWRDVSIIDVVWGPAFGVVAACAWWTGGGEPTRAALVTALVCAWGLRLGLHLALRARGRGEDARYAAMRAANGPRFVWQSLFTVFALQGALVLVISVPVQAAVAAGAERPLGALDALGAALFAAGLLCEAVADAQLTRFRADPSSRGRVLDHGLWRYSRHPNYFGDALLWWGLGLFGVAAGAPWTLVGPLLMTVLLLRVSGVTLLEKTIVERRPAYADYVRRTSAFVPWPPRRAAAPAR